MSNRIVAGVGHSSHHTGAIIVGEYRYLLWRTWDDALPRLLWVMLNPSIANEETDDPTVRRCIGFSQRWGYGSLEIVNLFALRTSDPSDLKHATDPVGLENDHYIAEAASRSAGIVVAWGEHGGFLGRDRAVLELLPAHSARPLYCLGVVRNGCPRHPLYAAGSLGLIPYHGKAR